LLQSSENTWRVSGRETRGEGVTHGELSFPGQKGGSKNIRRVCRDVIEETKSPYKKFSGPCERGMGEEPPILKKRGREYQIREFILLKKKRRLGGKS